jgi:hypothetical protein
LSDYSTVELSDNLWNHSVADGAPPGDIDPSHF